MDATSYQVDYMISIEKEADPNWLLDAILNINDVEHNVASAMKGFFDWKEKTFILVL